MKMIEDNRLLDRQRQIDAERRAQAILRQRPNAGIAACMARVANAPRVWPTDPKPPVTPTYGLCLGCGGREVRLNRVVGFKDYSGIGESNRYPVGDGCELCS